MKKTLLSIALAAVIGLAGFQVAEARQGLGPGATAGPGYGRMVANLDEDAIKARQQFHDETLELRRQIVVKQTELQAVLGSQKPDEKKAARLAEELFDLRTQKHQKAREMGIAMPGRGMGMGMGMGRGMGKAMGACQMMGGAPATTETAE
ncbi:MAG: periplasmic heavy metal sensor [Desulfurivibrio sp.]